MDIGGGEKDGLSRILVLIVVLFSVSTAGSFLGRGREAEAPAGVIATAAQSDKATPVPGTSSVDENTLRPLKLLPRFLGPDVPPAGFAGSTTDLANRLRPMVDRLSNDVESFPKRPVFSEVLVALVPDWVDSSQQWTFDSNLDALQISAAQLDYVLTAFDLPDTPGSAEEAKSTDTAPRRAHESVPGALLFRRIVMPGAGSGEPPRIEMALILLVPETTTEGVHPQAFANALDLALEWNSRTSSQREAEIFAKPAETAGRHRRPDGVAILGPNYSGSSASIRIGLEAAARRHKLIPTGRSAWFQIVTPSATNTRNADLLNIAGVSNFGSVVRSDDETLHVLSEYLGTIRRDWRCGVGVALLVESNTSWGRGFDQRTESCDACRNRSTSAGKGAAAEKGLLSCARYVQFPLHISRLRKEAQQSGEQPQAKLPTGYATRLDLSERTISTDRIAPVTPTLTDALSESMVAGMFRSLDDPTITAVGILATDKRDHVFLAQELASHRPSVQQFTIESSLVYLHPDSRSYVRGTVIASTYSLNTRTQALTREPRARLYTQQFASSGAHGVFNALAALMGEPGQMLDYDIPLGPGERATDRSLDTPCHETALGSSPCSPPVWISVAAQGTLLPIKAGSGNWCDPLRPGYASCAPGTRGPPDTTYDERKSLSGRGPTLPPTILIGCVLFLIGLIADQRRRALILKRDAAADPLLPESELELRVSTLALQAATLTIFLWVAKCAAIWLADRPEWVPLQVGRDVVVALCFAGFAWIALRAVPMLWSAKGHGRIMRWIGRLSMILCVFSSAAWLVLEWLHFTRLPSLSVLFFIVVVSAGISVFVDLRLKRFSELGSRVDQWRRVPALLGVVAFLYLSANLAAHYWEPADAILYLDRSMLPTSLVSPGVPIVLFAAAIYWWGCWNMRRVRLLRFPETEVGIGELLDTRSWQAGFDPDRMLRAPSLSMGYWIFIPAAALIVTGLGFRTGASIEGAYFGVFLFLASACIHTTMAHTLAHTISLACAVRKLLASLARHPSIGVMSELAKEPFDWRIAYREISRPAFEPLARHIERVGELLSQCAHDSPDALPRMARDLADELRFDKGRSLPAEKIGSKLWRDLNAFVNELHERLTRTRWSSGFVPAKEPTPASELLREMELVVFFHGAVVLRDLITRLISGFTAVLGGLAMLLLGHLLYTFQGRVYWLILDAAAISLAAAAAIYVMQGLERNALLSVLWKSTPGRISVFGQLTWRMGLYAVIGIVTLLATVFPELGGSLFAWLEPTRKLFSL